METKSQKPSTENFVKDIRRKTRRLFTSEQKILIVMEAIRGENPVAEICRKYGIHQTQFYKETFGRRYNQGSNFGRSSRIAQRKSTSQRDGSRPDATV